MRKMTAWLLALSIALALLAPGAPAATLEDGIYDGVAPGMNGDVNLHVVIYDDNIINILSEHSESDEVGKPAIDQLIGRAMEAQGPDVDAVAGATETSEAFVAALKDALTRAGWVEDDLPKVEIIVRRTPTPEPAPEVTPPPVAEISAPVIGFEGVETEEGGVAYLSDDIVAMNWHSDGDVQAYRLEVTDEDGAVVKSVDTSDTQYMLKRSALEEGKIYTATVTAIPGNGTLEADGVSAEARFALYVAPEPTPEPVLQTGEISDSWDEIIAAIDDGSARQRYAVGATKVLDLGELGTVHMQLAGFDLDERVDGNGKAATTWIAVELLPDQHVMNEEWTTEGGWRDSDLRAYLQSTVLPAMPSNVSKRVVWVKKNQKLADDDIQVTEDRIWIPDRSEIFGSDALYYDLIRDADENRVKTRNGSAAWWWLRSAYNSSYANYVGIDGSYINYGVYYSGGVALGFCL